MHIPTLEDRRFILVGAAVFAVVVLAVSKPSAAEEPAGTAFTYQGDLEERDTPVDGTVNFEFSLWDDPTDTDPEVWLGPMLSRTVYVEEGQFNVILDFGEDVFSGNARWLEIAMCSPSPCRDFITLTPRRELSTTAYALLVSGESENVQDQRTQQGQQGPPGTPGLARKFWTLKGNDGTTPGTNFLGTTDDEALELHVNGERALRLEPNATSPNLIGGYSGNTIESGAVGATIAGGGAASEENRVFYDYGTIGGGWNNQAGDDGGQTYKRGATVGGGQQNTASGLHSTVGGGHLNTASHDSATVGGGSSNTANFPSSTVGGGTSNTASSSQATVAGGYYNTASGSYSTVVGGIFNEATHESATVGGGHINSASNPYGTVGGGRYNTASGYDSTVGGGQLQRSQQ